MTVVQITDVVVRRSGKTLLRVDGLALTSRPTLVVGNNGAGKSTLLSTIAGHQRPTSGAVRVAGRCVLVEQNFRPIHGFTSREYCTYVAWLHGGDRQRVAKDADQWLDFTGLSDHRGQKCDALSGGEKARLAIATALNASADTLLLDEPSAALDPAAKADLSELYHRIADEGRNLVVSTHDGEDLQAPFERVVVLAGGRVVFEDTLGDFLALSETEASDNSPAALLARSFGRRRRSES